MCLNEYGCRSSNDLWFWMIFIVGNDFYDISMKEIRGREKEEKKVSARVEREDCLVLCFVVFWVRVAQHWVQTQ